MSLFPESQKKSKDSQETNGADPDGLGCDYSRSQAHTLAAIAGFPAGKICLHAVSRKIEENNLVASPSEESFDKRSFVLKEVYHLQECCFSSNHF